MSAIDLILTFAVVLSAASFLVWNLTGRGRKPACHTVSSPIESGASAVGADVVIGAALQKGLDRATAG